VKNEQQNIYIAFPKDIQTIEGQRKIDSTVLGGLPDMTTLDIREFDPNEKAVTDEWYSIALEDDDLNIVSRYLVKDEDATLDEYSLHDQNPVAVFEYADDDYLVFREITPKMVFRTRILFVLNGNVNIIRPDDLNKKGSFVVDEHPTAIYDVKKRRIIFQNFRRITKIFVGIDKFYREASEEDINQFKKKMVALIEFSNEFKIGTRNLSLIAQILDDEKPLDKSHIKQIYKFADKFPLKLTFEKGKPLHVSSDKELNSVLKLLQGWYYMNPITEEPMEASSAKRLSK
jgi:hypothetical protein